MFLGIPQVTSLTDAACVELVVGVGTFSGHLAVTHLVVALLTESFRVVLIGGVLTLRYLSPFHNFSLGLLL